MPRATWSGAVSFGLVNVPVKLYGAIREKRVSFHQLEAGSGARIRYRRVSEETGEEVPQEKIVKGYEVSRGQFVEVTPEELDAAEPEKSRLVDIEDFVDITDIDPLYFADAYYLEPDGRGAAKSYVLLVRSMEEAGRIAIGRFVMRTREYLVALRPKDGVLVLQTMHFADEIVDPKAFDIPGSADVADRELKAARQLIDSLTTDFEADKYRDTYRERVLDIVERKAEGEEIVVRPAAKEEAQVIDLMAALEASLEEAGKDKRRAASSKASASSAKKRPRQAARPPAKRARKRPVKSRSAPSRKKSA